MAAALRIVRQDFDDCAGALDLNVARTIPEGSSQNRIALPICRHLCRMALTAPGRKAGTNKNRQRKD